MSNPFHFRHKKAAQAIAALLRFETPRRMGYYRLLKLLYIADRESLRERGRPIIGGRLTAMEWGPLHSAPYDLIKGKNHDIDWWARYFATKRFDLEMTDDPGNSELSKAEIDLLNRVSAEHEMLDDFALGKLTHEFAEYKKNEPVPGKANTISFSDLLAALEMSEKTEDILKDAKEKATFDRVFGA